MADGKGRGWRVTMLLGLCCLLPALPVMAEERAAIVPPPVESCSDVAALLVRQEEKTSRELKQIKRDLAALGQQLEEPGLPEILGGIGYVFGIFGVAAYVASRRQPGNKGN
jgi:hypothetical protein